MIVVLMWIMTMRTQSRLIPQRSDMPKTRSVTTEITSV